MKHQKPKTLQELIALLGAPEIAKALNLHFSTPYTWLHGVKPSTKNALRVQSYAKRKGIRISLEAILGGDK